MIAADDDSARSQGSPGICFVTADFAGVVRNGGIGTHFWLMSRILARRGWRVHVLFCGEVDDRSELEAMPDRLAPEGITFRALDDLPAPAWVRIPHFGGDAPTLVLSQRALEALEALQAEHRFDMIEFPDWGALGFRSVQAKRTGHTFGDVRLAVKLHSPTQWQREGNLALRATPHDLKLEFCERYAFEHADVQLSPSNYMVNYTRSLDWTVRDDVEVAYPFPGPEPEPTTQATEVRELVFFGRLERRKGLELFLEALDDVQTDLPVLFLGRDTMIDGRKASELIAERLDDRPHRIETDLGREAALAELRRGDLLAVIASERETFGFTVAECIANRIPFIAARAGGIPEVVLHEEAGRRWLFEPSAAGLAQALERRLAANGDEEKALRAEAAAASDPDRWNARIEAIYRDLIARPLPAEPARSKAAATVTLAVAHYNHGDVLPAALSSIAAQTRPPDEVIVMDDGSTSDASQRVFAEQEGLYPRWTFLRQANAGPGAVRNACLERAEGTYFLPFDADNIAAPELVETLLAAMERDGSRAAASCHNLAFADPADIEAGRFAFRYAPTGGPLLASLLEDVFGDTCSLFRTEALRSVGGFETERWSPHEDWETFVKMAVRGLDVDVVPRVLCYYRTDPESRLRKLTADPAMTFRHRRHLIERFLADAELSRSERIELWESLLAFEYAAHAGIERALAWHQRQLDEQAAWHLGEQDKLMAWHHGEQEKLEAWAAEKVEAIRASGEAEAEQLRAELAERRGAGAGTELDDVLIRRAAFTDEFFFVQIGAFDGRTIDPIHSYVKTYRWRGLLVEPQKRHFRELKQTYRDHDNLDFRQVAIADRRGTRTLHTVAEEPGVPHWAGMLASFDKETLLSHRSFLPGLDALVRSEEVDCITLTDLLNDSGADHIDLLQVDVEGYDHEIIRTLDFERFAPSIIHFEHVHLDSEAYSASVNRLIDHGYRVVREEHDLLAYRPAEVPLASPEQTGEGSLAQAAAKSR